MGGPDYSRDELRAIDFARGVGSWTGVPDRTMAVTLSEREGELQSASASIAARVNDLLTSLDPSVFRAHLHPHRLQAELPEGAGLGVVAWMGAAMGAGSDGSVRTAELVVDGFTKWHLLESAARLAVRSLDDAEVISNSVTHGEWVRRTYSTQTRLVLLSELIVEGGVRAACDVNLGEMSPRSRKIHRVVGRLFTELRRFFVDHSRYLSTLSSIDVRQIAGAPTKEMTVVRNIISQSSVTEGSFSGKDFTVVMSGRAAEAAPFIELECAGSERYWPANLDALLFRPEVALFEAVRLSGLPRGEIFERAVRYVVQSMLSSDLRVIDGPVTMTPKVRGDDLETDLVIVHDNQAVFLGDDKCAAPTNVPSPNSLSRDDLGKGVAQVRKRLEALTGGRTIVMTNGETLPASPRCRGLVVTLHGHGGKLWSRDVLRQIDAGTDIAMIPLHSLALLLSTMTSYEDLELYLSFREGLIRKGVELSDEHEILLTYISGSAAPIVAMPEERADRKCGYLVRPYTLGFEDSLLLQRLPCRESRKKWLWERSIPVEPV